jgi:hypothetical protein
LVAAISRSHRDARTDRDRRDHRRRQLAQVLPSRRGRGGYLSPDRPHPRVGHGGRARGPCRRRRQRPYPRRQRAPLRQARLPQPGLCRPRPRRLSSGHLKRALSRSPARQCRRQRSRYRSHG